MRTHRKEKIIREFHPAKFRKNPILFVTALLLIFVYGIGLIILLVWWLSGPSETLIITERRVIHKKGFFDRDEMEIPLSQIGTLQIHQGFMDVLFGIGDISIASAGTSDYEMCLEGMPNPEKIKRIIDANQ